MGRPKGRQRKTTDGGRARGRHPVQCAPGTQYSNLTQKKSRKERLTGKEGETVWNIPDPSARPSRIACPTDQRPRKKKRQRKKGQKEKLNYQKTPLVETEGENLREKTPGPPFLNRRCPEDKKQKKEIPD